MSDERNHWRISFALKQQIKKITYHQTMNANNNINYIDQWYDTIAEQWVRDFVIRGFTYKEIQIEVTDPTGDRKSGAIFDIKNVICTIKVNDKNVYLWVFFNFKKDKLIDIEPLDTQDLDPEEIAQEIYAINERWKKQKVLHYLKQ